MNLKNINSWAKIKGIDVISTGDFTRQKYFKEMTDELTSQENGLFTLKSDKESISFILGVEVSCIYAIKEKIYKNHILIFTNTVSSAKKINDMLARYGNIAINGRPILKLDVKE